ncbi:MAG: Rne/Rng family ribonuclease [Desulfobulbaceae bacterium]|nr:Rne/Rng family ribonuclease [Desulfobulbaceae bacterium]
MNEDKNTGSPSEDKAEEPKKAEAKKSKPAAKKTTPKKTSGPAEKKAAKTTAKEKAATPKKPKSRPKKAPAKKAAEPSAKETQTPETAGSDTVEKPKKTRSRPRKPAAKKKPEPVKEEKTAEVAADDVIAKADKPQAKTPKGEEKKQAEPIEEKKTSETIGDGEAAIEKKPAQEEESKSKPANRKPRPRKKPAKKTVQSKPENKPAATTPVAEENHSQKLLINSDEPEEARIALIENGKLDSFHVETVSSAQTKGNIYKGIITAIEPNLQAVFVDMGIAKNGFLPFGDIHPEYYCKDVPSTKHWKDLKIQEVIRKGQEVLVEVVKEATGNKGASVTTYLSMPGRYVVLMPGSDSHGISRKIESETLRKKLREIVLSAKLPEEIGYIVRTASKDVTKTAMLSDIRYQLNLWKEIKKRGQTMDAPALVHKEQDVTARFLRDHFTPDIKEILVDNQEAFDQVVNFLDLLPARQRKAKVKLHKGARPIFNLYQIEDQIEQIYQPSVPLPSGGSIVINPTEALVAIDVNSGRTSKDKNFSETIFLANMEAAEELARQLRLRDLGGLIVVDFIDMRDKRHIKEVEKKVKACMKNDKAKVDMSRISKFGLLQISRQRLGPPVQKGSYIACDHCQGLGVVRSVETMALAQLRRIHTGAIKKNTETITCHFPLTIAQYMLNQKRSDLLELEKKYQVRIHIIADPDMKPSQSKIEFTRSDES